MSITRSINPRLITVGQVVEDSASGDFLGITDRDKILRYLQRAVETLANKAQWPSLLATVDICVSSGCITLPADCEAPLALSINGAPAMMRDQWFQFHMNGPGAEIGGSGVSWVWDDRGFSPCFHDVNGWSYVAAIAENAADNGKYVHVMGITMDSQGNEKSVWSDDPENPGTLIEGFKVKLVAGVGQLPRDIPQIKRVTYVNKPVTAGYVKLVSFNTPGGATRTIGYYEPHVTIPEYRRIRISQNCTWVRMLYRRSLNRMYYDYDIIPLNSYEALLLELKAVRLREQNQIEAAEEFELKAVSLLSDEMLTSKGNPVFKIQYEPGFFGPGTVDIR